MYIYTPFLLFIYLFLFFNFNFNFVFFFIYLFYLFYLVLFYFVLFYFIFYFTLSYFILSFFNFNFHFIFIFTPFCFSALKKNMKNIYEIKIIIMRVIWLDSAMQNMARFIRYLVLWGVFGQKRKKSWVLVVTVAATREGSLSITVQPWLKGNSTHKQRKKKTNLGGEGFTSLHRTRKATVKRRKGLHEWKSIKEVSMLPWNKLQIYVTCVHG